jgi:ribonuclease P protein component
MLSYNNRLPAIDIPFVMKRGKRVACDGFTFIYKKRIDTVPASSSRFAFIVSTKVDKRAAVRNRMRRILSESVRLQMGALPFAVDGIFVGNKNLLQAMQVDVEPKIVQVFSSVS